MILNKKVLIAVLLSFFLTVSIGSAEERSGIDLEILGKPISAMKKAYSCAPAMIAGPSKRKIICANSSEKFIYVVLKKLNCVSSDY